MIKHNNMLTVTSLLSIVLLTLHVTDDIVRGYERWGFEKLSFVLILVVWTYGTLLLADRKSGRIIMLLGGTLAGLMPAIHMLGKGSFVKSSGAFFFIWTLLVLGATGTLSAILAIRELRRGKIITAVANESPDRRG